MFEIFDTKTGRTLAFETLESDAQQLIEYHPGLDYLDVNKEAPKPQKDKAQNFISTAFEKGREDCLIGKKRNPDAALCTDDFRKRLYIAGWNYEYNELLTLLML